MKKRTKAVFVVLAFVVGLSYFVFTLVFFDPFEGDYLDGDLSTAVAIEYAVPRNIDFFIHKRGLENDFGTDGFPVPAAWNGLQLNRNWRDFEATPLYQRLAGKFDVGAHVAAVREAVSRIPLVGPLDDLLGRDCAVFGRIEGQGYDHTEVGLVCLGSGMARFAYEAASSGLVRTFVSMPFDVEIADDGTRVFTLEDGKKIHAWRYLDLFVISSGPLLVREVKELIELRDVSREKSLGATRRYSSVVAQDVEDFAGFRPARRTEPADLSNRVQARFRLGPLFSQTTADDEFLENRGELSRWVAARLFNPRYFEDLALDVGFGPTLDVRGMLGFFRDKAEQAATGFYDRKTFELQSVMDDAARRLPEETYFMMAARVDMRRFLPMLVNGLSEMDPDARKTLDEVMQRFRKARPDFRPATAMEAAQQVASFLGDDIVFALRRDTYFGAPRHPMPIVTLILKVTDRGPTMDQLNAANGDPSRATGYNGFVFPIMKAHPALGSVAKWFNVSFPPPPPKPGDASPPPAGVQVQDVLIGDPGGTIKSVSFGILESPSQTEGPWTLAVTFSPRVENFPTPEKSEGEARGTACEMLTDLVKLSEQARIDPDRAVSVSAPDLARGGSRSIRPLFQSERYKGGRDFLKGFASVAVYLNAPLWKEVLLDQADEQAAFDAREDRAWWDAKRKEFADELYAGEFSTWRGKTMPRDVQERFDARIKEREERLDEQQVDDARRAYKENLAWVDLLEDAFLAARIDENSQNIELRARLRTTLTP